MSRPKCSCLVISLLALPQYIFLCFTFTTAWSIPTTNAVVIYTGMEYLDSAQKYTLHWNIDDETETMYFWAVVETTGWVGFGLSPNGAMTGADILIVGIHTNGSIYSSDRHGVGNSEPVPDIQSDWIVTEVKATDKNTSIRFQRKLNTCDEQDLEITDGTMRVIWAFGTTQYVSYHVSNRGTKSINFYLPNENNFKPELYQTIDLTLTMEMPSAHTTYWCKIFKAPILSDKHHIVAFDAVLDNIPAIEHTHHFVVYHCTAPDQVDMGSWADHPGDYCYAPTNTSFPFLLYCATSSIYVWNKGGKRLVFPDNMGLPIPTQPGKQEFYALEVHYNNPQNLKNVSFKTGAIMYHTNNTRPVQVGLLALNHFVNPQLTVPPLSKDYVVSGHCSGECTDHFLPEDGITIFSNRFHSHLAGRRMKLRHFRGSKELPWVDVDEYYDFDYQQHKPLRSFRKVERGDQLTVECTYDSMNAGGGEAIIGGLSTQDEMCEAVVYYYPRQAFFYCASTQNMDEHLKLLGITKYQLKNGTIPGSSPQVEIVEPPHMAGDYQESISHKMNWTNEFRQQFQQTKRYGQQVSLCYSGVESLTNGTVKYPDNLEVYVPPNICDSYKPGI